jgi:hypothetical protein
MCYKIDPDMVWGLCETVGSITQKKYETYGLCYQSLGNQSLDDQRFTHEDWINQFEIIPKQTKEQL